MPTTMDPFLRAYTGADSASNVPNSLNMPRKRNPLDELDDASVSSGRKSSLSDRKSSLGSDSLWGDARKLSEAGVRRTSDSSVVLTEDTDSFIIGDKIWVGGVKPGTIAYIGETQFAPGEWAGIVLDQPIGKNDGSVANTRYFQCEPKRGIFSRLTRLTRMPLGEGGSGGDLSMSFANNGNASIAHITPTSPPSTITRPSSAASMRGELKEGDRVIVMSSTGSRAGMLRYIGETDFAKGVWCGVECDDPVGKNDGAVQGVRYFTCQPMYGLFAPVAKVSLSPSPHRRPSCAVHPPPSGPARQNTKDSITSTASSRASGIRKPSRPGPPSKTASVASTTEATLREKEMYIEQLLKERDMERLAVTRAATQAEEAERQVDMLKQELRQLQEVSEATQADLLHQIAEVHREKKDLSNLMEDEHNKLDDITFRFEEEKMAKVELETTSKVLEERINQLEQALLDETNKKEVLEKESNRIFEAEETIAKLQATLDEKDAELKLASESSGSQVIQLKEKIEKIMQDNESIRALLREEQLQNTNWKNVNEESKKLRLQMETDLLKHISQKDQLEKEIKNLNLKQLEYEFKINESERHNDSLQSKLDKATNEFKKDRELLTNELKVLSDKYRNLEDEINNKISEISVLNLNVSQLQNKLKSKEEDIDELNKDSNNKLDSFRNEITDLKNILSSKSVEFESKEDILKMEINDLKQCLLEAKKESEEQDKKIKSASEDSLKKLTVLEGQVKEKQTLLENFKNESEIEIDAFKNQLKAQTQIVNSMKENNEKITLENNELKKEKEKTLQLAVSAEEKVSELNNQIELLNQTVNAREEEIKNIKLTNDEMNKSLASLTLELGDSKRNCEGLEEKCKQISELKSKLERDLSELMNSSSDSSQQLVKLNDSLRCKEKECAELQETCAELHRQMDSSLQKAQQEQHAAHVTSKAELELIRKNFNEALSGKDKDIENISSKLAKTVEMFEKLKKTLEEVEFREKESETKLLEIKGVKEELQYKLEKEMRVSNKLELELEKSRQGAGEVEVDLRNNVSSLEKLKDTLEAELKDTRNRLSSLQMEVDEKKKKEEALKENLEAVTREKELVISKYEANLAAVSSNIESLKSEKDRLENTICERDVQIVQLQTSVEFLKTESEKRKELIDTKEKKVKELIDMFEKSNLDASNLRNALEELQERLQQQENVMNTDRSKLDETLTDKERAIMDLQNVIGDLEKQVRQTNDLVKDRESQLSKIQTELEEKCLLKDELLKEAKLSNLQMEEKMVSLEKELDKKKSNNNEESSMLKTEIESLQSKLSKSEEKRVFEEKKMQEQLDKKEKDLENLQRALDEGNEQIKSIKKLSEELEQENKKILQGLEKEKQASINSKNLVKELEHMEESQRKLELQLAAERETSKSINFLKEGKVKLEKQVDSLIKENNDLKNKLKNQAELSNSIPIETTNNNTTGEIDSQMTIKFLNSMIADLQRELEVKEELIQRQQSGEFSDPNMSTRTITPRLYCDICEMFDLHDTEDCPRQAMDSPPPRQMHNLPRGFERPYCDACEMFGHETGACEDETF